MVGAENIITISHSLTEYARVGPQCYMNVETARLATIALRPTVLPNKKSEDHRHPCRGGVFGN